MKKKAKALPVRKKSGAKKTIKAKAPRKQFVKPRVKAVVDVSTPTNDSMKGITRADSKPRFVYIEARRFEDDGVITFDSIEVQGARDEAEAYTFGAAQLDTRQQANDPDNNPHLLATPANDYVVTL